MRRVTDCFRRFLLARIVLAIAILAAGVPGAVKADVIVNSAQTGPLNGDGGTFTVTTAGSITGGGNGIQAGSGGTAITGLDVQGEVLVGALGVSLPAGGSIGLLTNSGTVQGGVTGMNVAGTITTLSNLSGGRIAGTSDHGIAVSGIVTSLSNAGSIAGGTLTNDSGVRLTSSGTIGTLTNTGIVGTTGGYFGIGLANSSGIGSIVNSGTIQSGYYGINEEGALIGSILNQAGGRIYGADVGVGGGLPLSIDNYGTIEGGDRGIAYNASGAIGAITNRAGGVIRSGASEAITSSRELASITNETGGLIEGVSDGIRLRSNISTITNAGTIRALGSSSSGIRSDSPIVNLTNSGTIQAVRSAINVDEVSGTFTNTATGVLDGGQNGYEYSDDANVIINAGVIRGGRRGVWADDTFVSLTNQAGGVISGTSVAGIDVRWNAGTINNEAGGTIESGSAAGVLINPSSNRTPGTLINGGLIRGATGGVRIESSGRLNTITNSGTIAYTGAGTGPAVFVGTGRVLGVASGTAGPAIVSTGAGARLDGTIVNQGTIHHGFTIANQDVTVSAGGGAGTFTSGSLTVIDGDLTFTDGQTTLDAAISVDGGLGTVFNEGTLRLTGIETLTGNFQQFAGGTMLMDLLGTGDGQYGRFDISGAATFAGNLAITDTGLTGGLVPGQNFRLFDFASYTGDFTGLLVNGTLLADLGGGLWGGYGDVILREDWTSTSMSLTVLVPEIDPAGMGSVLALLASGLGLLERRRLARKTA